VWLIIFPGEIQDYLAAGAAEHPTLAWLEARFSVERIETFGELQVYHFVRPRASNPSAPSGDQSRGVVGLMAAVHGGRG
jgi:hypothetical protein